MAYRRGIIALRYGNLNALQFLIGDKSATIWLTTIPLSTLQCNNCILRQNNVRLTLKIIWKWRLWLTLCSTSSNVTAR